ncbi:MAG: GDYXXLXY domain-containing protein [Pseudomonadales bacterium]|jgi:uncharacterized membrane-anchored protein|nr:GDYXXLXY domain-containing protein [Pseudomonadales bacterium]
MNAIDTSATQPLIAARTLRLLSTISAAALFAFGLLCWIAANWSALHRLTRLGLVGGLLLLSIVTATVAPRARIPALLLATALSGGLLALLGQVYPSGADAWQLFALWTLLALPFALAARHGAPWLLWAVVASAAIVLWQFQQRGGLDIANFGTLWLLSFALALVLAPIAPLRALLGNVDWAFRLAVAGALAWVVVTDLVVFFTEDTGSFLLILALLSAAALALLRSRPLEFGLLTLTVAAIDTLLIAHIGDALFNASSDGLLVGLIAAFIVGGSIVLLRMAHGHFAPARSSAAGQDGISWPLVALSGFGALLTAAPLLVFLVVAVFDSAFAGPGLISGVGMVSAGAGILLLRGGAPLGFRQLCGLIVLTLGAALVGIAMLDGFVEEIGFALAALATLAAYLTPPRWVRLLCGFAALPAFIFSIFARASFFSFDDFISFGINFLNLIVVAGAVILLVLTPRQDALGRARDFFMGWSVAGLLALMLFAGRPFLIGAGVLDDFDSLFFARWSNTALSIACASLSAAFLLWRRPELRKPPAFAVAACAILLSWYAPTLGAALALIAAALLAGAHTLAVAASVAIVWILSTFYYSLVWPLAQKGYFLMTLGVALALALLLSRQRATAVFTMPRFTSGAALFILLGALASIGIAGQAIISAERLLREGRVIYLALAPADPRSLLQGDYMRLAFDTRNLPDPEYASGPSLALANVDERSVATLQTLVPANTVAAPDQILLQIRAKSGRWFIGSDAFYFQEGTADLYENAKFGQFRVGPNGRMLLSALADQELRLLPQASTE